LTRHKSVEKRARQNEKRRIRNRSWMSKIKTASKKIEKAVADKNIESLDDLYRDFSSIVDKAVSKGVLHENTANRKKSRIACKIVRIKSSGSTVSS